MDIRISSDLEARFREAAMKRWGYKKGALKAALEEAIELWLEKLGGGE